MKSFVLFVFFLGCSWSGSALDSSEVSILNYPYMASIEVDGKHLCSATIVDDVYVLTAKTCVQNLNVSESSVFVRVGTNKIEFRGQDLQVTDIYVSDSSFYLTTVVDLAMVKVATAFEYDTKVSWANPNNDGLSEGMEGYVLGWKNLTKSRSAMIAAPAVVISSDTCSTAYNGIYNVSSSQACIQPTVASSKSCLADLGAPFYLNEQIYGVVSYNPGCDSDLPIVVTEVGGSGAFIVEVLIDIMSFF